MNAVRVWWLRLTGFINRERLDAELEEELRFHLTMRAQENAARGMSPDESAAHAARQFGNIDLVKDSHRDVTRSRFLEQLHQDVRFATHVLLKDRAFTSLAIVALALGIGLSSAVFTAAERVLLRPLPFPDAARLMAIRTSSAVTPDQPLKVAFPDFLDFRKQNRWFEGMGAYYPRRFVGPDAASLRGAFVSSEMLAILGVEPVLGRLFHESEDEAGNRVVIVSQQLWEERFGDRGEIGDATITLDGQEFRIVGVMPRDFHFPLLNEPAQLWTTMAVLHDPPFAGGQPITESREHHYFQVVGRLSPGVDGGDAQAGLRGVAAELAAKYPETNQSTDSCSVVSWRAHITESVQRDLLVLAVAAFCMLGVATANVANLLLARGTTREREIAIRVVLAAGRGRILRQLLTENLLLAAIAGVLGAFIAMLCVRYMAGVLPQDFPRLYDIVPDGGVLLVTCVITVGSACAFGILPAWRSSRCPVARLLNDCNGGSTERAHARRLRNALVAAELSFAVVLLASASLLIRDLYRLRGTAPGFDAEQLLTVQLLRPDSTTPGVPGSFFEQLVSQVSALPDVQFAAAVSHLPLSGRRLKTNFEITGSPLTHAELPEIEISAITSGFHAAMKIPLVQGRDFVAGDNREAPAVALINETFARQAFPGESPIGRRVTPVFPTEWGGAKECVIVGVIGDVKTDTLARENRPSLYVPEAQCLSRDMTLLLRSAASAEIVTAGVQAVASKLDTGTAFHPARPMKHYVAGTIARPRLQSTLLGWFAFIAVTQTVVGVYAVMSYSVAQRRREIGIRVALGAQRLAILRLVLGEGIWLTAAAVAVGILCAVGGAPMLRSFSDTSTINDVPIIAAVALLVSTVALIACWIPARSTGAIEPLTAMLRH